MINIHNLRKSIYSFVLTYIRTSHKRITFIFKSILLNFCYYLRHNFSSLCIQGRWRSPQTFDFCHQNRPHLASFWDPHFLLSPLFHLCTPQHKCKWFPGQCQWLSFHLEIISISCQFKLIKYSSFLYTSTRNLWIAKL